MLAGKIDVQFRVRGSKGADCATLMHVCDRLLRICSEYCAEHQSGNRCPRTEEPNMLTLATSSYSRRYCLIHFDSTGQERPVRGPAVEDYAGRRGRVGLDGARLDQAARRVAVMIDQIEILKDPLSFFFASIETRLPAVFRL